METMSRPKPDASSARAAVLDRPHLARYTMGDQALEAEILELFVKQAPLTIGRLRQSGDEKQWREASHTLKGSARAVGAWRLAACAEACEQIDSQGSTDAVAACLADVAAAYAEVAGLIEQICRDARCAPAGRAPAPA